MEARYRYQTRTRTLPNGEVVTKTYLKKYLARTPKPPVPSDEEMPKVVQRLLSGTKKIDIAAEYGISLYMLNKRLSAFAMNHTEATAQSTEATAQSTEATA